MPALSSSVSFSVFPEAQCIPVFDAGWILVFPIYRAVSKLLVLGYLKSVSSKVPVRAEFGLADGCQVL